MRFTADQIRAHALKHGLHSPLLSPDEAQSRALPSKTAQSGEKDVTVPDDDCEPPDAFQGAEKLLHREFAADCQRRGIHIVHARCDQAATIGAGLPDFHLLYTGTDGITRAAAVEFKRSGGSLSPKQREVIADIRRKGIPVKVAFTLRDAIDFAKRSLGC